MKSRINNQSREIVVLLSVAAILILLGISFAFSGYSEPTEGEWVNTTWNYRIRVEVNTTSVNATDWPVEIPVNFSDMIDQALHFDNNSLRVYEYNSTGKIIREVPSQFDTELGYNETTNAAGEVVFSLNGTTPPFTSRIFYVYWDYLENNPKPAPGYLTSLTYEWDGRIARINTTKLDVRINTDGQGNVSGIYHVADRITTVPIIITGSSNSDLPAEYLEFFNGTDNVTFDLVGNATFVNGPVRLTIIQQGDEVLFGNASNKTGMGSIVKKYHFYDRAGPQSEGSFIKISHEFFAISSDQTRSSNVGAIALDVQRTFLSQDVSSLAQDFTDPYSWIFATDSGGSVAGIINVNESVSNYSALNETLLGRIGINLTGTTVSVGSSIKEIALVFFGGGGSNGVSEFLDIRNTTRSPVIALSNRTEKLLVSVVASINRTSFNLNETIYIKANITSGDPYNLTFWINATLDNGTANLTIQLYDDGLAVHNDDLAGDKVYTNNYTFVTNSNIAQWSLNLSSYGNNSNLLNSTIFLFNVTDVYFVNISLFNPIGIINRLVLGNVTIQNFARTNGITAALANCTVDGSEIFNRIDLNNGTYLINFTSPGVEGTFNVTCLASRAGNTGNDTKILLNEPAQTNLTISTSPTAVSADSITLANNNTFLVTANLTNIALGTGKNANISVVLLPGWSANTTIEQCGDIGVNESCVHEFNITVPNGTVPGVYSVGFNGSWTNPDDTQKSNTTNVSVTVLSNPQYNLTEENVSGIAADGAVKVVGTFTLNSIGNSPAENFTYSCTEGFACSNFNITFSPVSVTSIDVGSSQVISVIVQLPLNHTPGNFTGLINITSPAGNQSLPLFLELQNKTNVSVTTDPSNTTVTGVSVANSVNVSIRTNVTNTGNSSARNTTLIFVLPENWTISQQNQSCGDVVFNSTCQTHSNFTVPSGTTDGTFNVTVIVSWTNLDGTTELTIYNMTITVATSPTIDVTSNALYGAVSMNTTTRPFNITVLSVGNSPILDVNFTCESGVVCTNFTPSFNPGIIASMNPGSDTNVSVNITVPYMFPAGNFTGIVNVSTSNDGSEIITLTVEVLANRTWNMTPLTCRRSLFPDEGKVCDVNITNLGNAPINFTIVNITANKTYPNVTIFSVPQDGSYTFSILYNITGFPQEIYNSTYVVVASQASTPLNFTLNVSLLPATPPNITLEISNVFAEQGTQINITANITDMALTGLSGVNITIERPNGTVDRAEMIMLSISGNFTRWQIIYPNATNISDVFGNTTGQGVYNITVLAEDNIGNVGNKTANFSVRFKIGITSQPLSAQYVQGDTGSIYYSVRDISNSAVQGVNVTFTITDPNSTLLYVRNITTDGLGTFSPLPVFSLSDDAPVGTWRLNTVSNYTDTVLGTPFMVEKNYTFSVTAKTITVAGLFADVETAVVWFPDNVMRFNLLIYDGQGTPVDPDNFNLTVLDPAQNRYFSIEMNSSTKQGIGYYSYSFAMPSGSATGMYLAVLNLTKASLSTMKLRAFRVASGGPYDVRLNLAKSEVQQGTPLDFTIVVENKGEVTQDVFIDYNISNVATGVTYYTASEAVLTPAFTNQSFTRSAFIFSAQPLGTYTLKAVVRYDPVQPAINVSSTFLVISGINITQPPSSTGGGGGGPGSVTGIATGDTPQPVVSLVIEKYSDEIKVYPGFKKIEYVIVRNAGKTQLTDISLSILGIPTSWYSISPGVYSTMEPDNSTVFLIEYNIPKDANVGDYKFNLVATSGTTSDQKAVTLKVLGSVGDLILSEIAALKEALKNLLIDIGVAKNEGKNVDDVLLIVTEIEKNIDSAEKNYNLGNTQTALDNIKDAKILLDKAKDLLSKLKSVRVEGDITPIIIGFLLLAIIIAIIFFVLRQRNMVPKQLSETVGQFTHIIDKIRPKVNTEGAVKEKERLIRMMTVLDKEKRDNLISESAYNEMRKSIESKLSKVDRKLR